MCRIYCWARVGVPSRRQTHYSCKNCVKFVHVTTISGERGLSAHRAPILLMNAFEFQPAVRPADEVERLRALRDLDILDSDPEETFDDLTALAAQLVGVPMALVSLIDADRQWFKSRQGVPMRQTPREWSFCAHAILGDGLMEVEDASADARFAGNPLVTGAPQVRFYAGVPLRDADGHALGTLCVLDRQPRRLEAAQREALARLARQAMRAIETRQAARRLRIAQRRAQRLADFRALLAEVSQAIAHADDDLALLRQACALAVRYAGASLMYVARPDAAGRFEFIASAGGTDYLRDLVVSTDPREPEGRGFAGRAWREHRAFYIDDFLGTPELAPWHAAAARHGFRAAATLPIERAGRIWAVMTILDAQASLFDEDLRELLANLAQELSRGLDGLDLASRERESRALLQRALAYQRGLMDKNAAGMFTVDAQGRIRDVNPALCDLLGQAREQLLDQPAVLLFPQGDEGAHFARLAGRAARGRLRGRHEQAFRHRDGSLRLCEVCGVPIELLDGTSGVLWSVIDVTALHQARETIAFQARHDALTGLPNRRALEQHLPRALQRPRRVGGMVALGMLDLDDFKPVNDAHGHEAGDALLREFGRRLRERMREGDFLARFGGDEFVLVLEDLDEHAYMAQLDAALQRLHAAVEQDFTLPSGQQVAVGMSLGLALMPPDGGSADALMRQADAALYEIKSRKGLRERWWQLGAVAAAGGDAAPGLDPFDTAAAEALRSAMLPCVLESAAYEQRLRVEWAAPEDGMAPGLLEGLAHEEATHLGWLLGPQADREQARRRGHERGRARFLMGLGAAMLTRGSALLQQELRVRLRAAPVIARTRLRVLQVADARLQQDLQAQVQAYERTSDDYFEVFDQPAPRPGTPWSDALRMLLEPVGALDGMLACMVMRPDSQGQFQIEADAGPAAQGMVAELRQARYQVRQDDDSPAGRGLVGSAWRSGRVQSTDEYADDVRLSMWRELMRGHGVRSVIAIPVASPHGGTAFVLVLFGAWPGQFRALRMRQFARSLQQRAAAFWSACRSSAQALVLPLEVAQSYRAALFRGGLQLYMQPVVDLRDGSVRRVEALARLRRDDDELILPGRFLPLLGDSELDRLLRLVLEQALGWLRAWDERGLHLDIAVNLPPTALLHAQCAQWVAQALRASGIPARRLTLELLETQEFDTAAQAGAIAALAELGVKLAMDDLGSGYSSLRRLGELPFDTVKVDQSLTLNLRRAPMLSFSLISTLIKMGRDLGRQVVVEGIQDADTLGAVVALGATLGQGFALARPMPAERVADWCASSPTRAPGACIEGPLGALALHWAWAHGEADDCGCAPDCPVAQWLRRSGLDTPELNAWHSALHGDRAAWSSEHPFVRWLLARLADDTRGLAA